MKQPYNTPLQIYQQSLKLVHEQENISCQFGLAAGNLTELISTAVNFLHPQEIEYLQNLKFERRQFSFLLGRYCSKKTVACFNKLEDLTHFQVKKGSFQQPFLSGNGVTETQISLSHTDTISTSIVFPSSLIMGIDMEYLQPKYETILQNQLQDQELKLIKSQFTLKDPIFGLTFMWTVKEALAKALKTGLTIPLNLLAIDNIESQGQYWLSTFENFSQYHALSFHVLDFIFTIVFPKQYRISLDVGEISTWLTTLDSQI